MNDAGFTANAYLFISYLILKRNFMKISSVIVAAFVSIMMSTGCATRVVVARPAPRVEIIPVAPSPRHVWVKGYYVRRGRDYVWVPGYYVIKRGRRY